MILMNLTFVKPQQNCATFDNLTSEMRLPKGSFTIKWSSIKHATYKLSIKQGSQIIYEKTTAKTQAKINFPKNGKRLCVTLSTKVGDKWISRTCYIYCPN